MDTSPQGGPVALEMTPSVPNKNSCCLEKFQISVFKSEFSCRTSSLLFTKGCHGTCGWLCQQCKILCSIRSHCSPSEGNDTGERRFESWKMKGDFVVAKKEECVPRTTSTSVSIMPSCTQQTPLTPPTPLHIPSHPSTPLHILSTPLITVWGERGLSLKCWLLFPDLFTSIPGGQGGPGIARVGEKNRTEGLACCLPGHGIGTWGGAGLASGGPMAWVLRNWGAGRQHVWALCTALPCLPCTTVLLLLFLCRVKPSLIHEWSLENASKWEQAKVKCRLPYCKEVSTPRKVNKAITFLMVPCALDLFFSSSVLAVYMCSLHGNRHLFFFPDNGPVEEIDCFGYY